MKLRLLSFVILGTVAYAADGPSGGGDAKPVEKEAKADGFSNFATADALWGHIEELKKEPAEKPKSREELVSVLKKWFENQNAASKAFVERYPKDVRRYDAELMSMQTAAQLSRLPDADPGLKPDMEKNRARIAEIIAAPDVPEDTKCMAEFIYAVTTLEDRNPKPESAAAFFAASEAFIQKHKGHALVPKMRQVQLKTATKVSTPEGLAILRKIAAGEDAALAEAAKKEVGIQSKINDLKVKPMEMKFVASDGREVDLQKLRGKVVLIDFWASWCGPCMAEAPNVVATYKKLHDQGFEIVGVSLDQQRPAMEAAMQAQGMTWPQYFDGKGWENAISSEFGIRSIPATWLLDKKGMLRKTNVRGGALEEGVSELLAEAH